MGEEADQSSRDRDQQIAPVGKSRRWRGIDQDVPDEPAAQAGCPGQDQYSEQVQVLADGDERTGHGEDEDAKEVEPDPDRPRATGAEAIVADGGAPPSLPRLPAVPTKQPRTPEKTPNTKDNE